MAGPRVLGNVLFRETVEVHVERGLAVDKARELGEAGKQH